MKLYLIGHDYKYAAEQMLLTLFPDERPVYPDTPPAPEDGTLVLRLSKGASWVTATARLSWRGATYTALRRCRPASDDAPLERDRAYQRVLKLAFYRVGTRALGAQPPWGALTGVRPVKLPERDLRSGKTPEAARRRLEREYFVAPARSRRAPERISDALAWIAPLPPSRRRPPCGTEMSPSTSVSRSAPPDAPTAPLSAPTCAAPSVWWSRTSPP